MVSVETQNTAFKMSPVNKWIILLIIVKKIYLLSSNTVLYQVFLSVHRKSKVYFYNRC